MPRKGQTLSSKGKTRPKAWVSGPDPIVHKKYRVWLQQRNQANWRGEEWQLPFDVWNDLWKDLWDQRGRYSEQYCMTRDDPEGPWTTDNVIIITRREHAQRHRERLDAMGKVKGYKKKLGIT